MPNDKKRGGQDRINPRELCGYVAISDTYDQDNLLEKLVELVVLENAPVPQISILTELKRRFQIGDYGPQADDAIRRSLGRGRIIETPTGFILSPNRLAVLTKSIDTIHGVEKRVKAEWKKEIETERPKFDFELLWECLRDFLTEVYRRNGLETLSLLDSSVSSSWNDGVIEHVKIRKTLEACSRRYARKGEVAVIIEEVSRFLEGAETKRERALFLGQIASGVFSFLSLRIPPEVSNSLRSGLQELIVFIDTNVLFSLFGLHGPTDRKAGEELLSAIKAGDLPIKLRYHEATEREFKITLAACRRSLLHLSCSSDISAAAVKASAVDGLELGYHKKNSESPITPEDYFLRYDDLEELAKALDIQIYRVSQLDNEHRADLEADYRAFLERIRKEQPKQDDAIEHDCEILKTVRKRRKLRSTLFESGYVILSQDFTLYNFERAYAKRHDSVPGVILPPQFMQLMRPFLTQKDDFDIAFANACMLPELREIDGQSEQAKKRMISLMSSVDGLGEKHVYKVLTNKALALRVSAASEGEQNELVKAEIISQLNGETAKRLDAEGELQNSGEKLKITEKQLEAQKKIAQEAESERNRQIQVSRELARSKSFILIGVSVILPLVLFFALDKIWNTLGIPILLIMDSFSWILIYVCSVLLVAAVAFPERRIGLIVGSVLPIGIELIRRLVE